MNTNVQDAAAPQPPNRGSARGRGNRGGARSAKSGAQRTVVAKAPTSKVGPNRLLETDWVKEASLADASFVFLAVSGKSGDQQWTFHRPIGETPLSVREWVATPTRDLNFLLQRRESEALSGWKRQAELAKRRAVLSASAGRRLSPDGQTEVWAFDGAPAIQPTIQSCMHAAKTAGKQESTWLDHAASAVQTAERTFKEALRTQSVPKEWLEANPKPAYETMGGALGDVPQKPVEYLSGLSLAAARDKVTRVAIGVDNVDDDSSSSEDEEDEDAGEAENSAPTDKPSKPASPAAKAGSPSPERKKA